MAFGVDRMKQVRIMFMGTPEFAATILQGLIDNNYNVVAVVSQPDRPIGRKKVIMPTPTKKIALANNIPVFQCEKIRKDFAFVNDIKPDLIITCAYGQIVPQAMLDIPPYGCINVHGSLLPKLRGGAPIHRAIMNGDKEAGICIMKMIDKMDAGCVYAWESTKIDDSDDLQSLSERLQIMGRDLLIKVLPDYLDGKLVGVEQDESAVTFGYIIKKEEERINWNQDARVVFNHIRALSPKPGAYTTFADNVYKIYKTEIADDTKPGIPGQIIADHKELIVACKIGSLRLLVIQPAGKSKMDVAGYLNGMSQSIVGKNFI